MKIAVAQMRTTAGELERTAERMVELAKKAADEGAQLVVFPAAALMGVTIERPLTYFRGVQAQIDAHKPG